jgi:deoxyribodipyrimidine photo-lyase
LKEHFPKFKARQHVNAPKMDQKESKEILIYLIRRDLRTSDNPILHSLSTQKHHPFTYILPLYIFNADQLDISGFIPEGEDAKSPYKQPRSQVGGFLRYGPHRSKFLVESVWDLKEELEKLGSGLCIRVGSISDVIRELIPQLSRTERSLKVGAIWMVSEEGIEESAEERTVQDACVEGNVNFKLWDNEKYLIDE